MKKREKKKRKKWTFFEPINFAPSIMSQCRVINYSNTKVSIRWVFASFLIIINVHLGGCGGGSSKAWSSIYTISDTGVVFSSQHGISSILRFLLWWDSVSCDHLMFEGTKAVIICLPPALIIIFSTLSFHFKMLSNSVWQNVCLLIVLLIHLSFPWQGMLGGTLSLFL